MKYVFQILCVFFIFSTCKQSQQVYENYTSEVLKIEQVGDHIFQHTSYLKTRSLGIVPCNGMVYINKNEAIVFDTPVNDKASEELINWIGEKHIKAIVVTHFHIDCLGGLAKFHAKGIPSYATNQTIQLAKEKNKKHFHNMLLIHKQPLKLVVKPYMLNILVKVIRKIISWVMFLLKRHYLVDAY